MHNIILNENPLPKSKNVDHSDKDTAGNSRGPSETASERFSEQMAQLCMNNLDSDVAFIVEGERLPGHRAILAARSEFFRAMLYGGMSEAKQKEINLDVPLEPFKAILKYIYSGQLRFSQISDDHILDFFGLAHQYGFTELISAISDYLINNLDLDNVCALLNVACFYSIENLLKACLMLADEHATELLMHESFKFLSQDSLVLLLSRDYFFADEEKIFLGVQKWCTSNPNVDVNSVLSLVRLPLMSLDSLLSIVRPSGLISSEKLQDAIAERTWNTCLPYRVVLRPEKNVAVEHYSARVIKGKCRSKLLKGDFNPFDSHHRYTSFNNSDDNDVVGTTDGFIIELGTLHILNNISIWLWNLDSCAYSYYIETSIDGTQWERILDYSNMHCRSWQYLNFEARKLKYIKVVGTHNSPNKEFHVVRLEALYTRFMPRIVDGFVVPTQNVAKKELGALVVDSHGCARNDLIICDNAINCGRNSGCTINEQGSDKIVVQLAQPFYISNIRLFFRKGVHLNSVFYDTFHIETSVDQQSWEVVVDEQREHVSSREIFSFTPRPVVYIRINTTTMSECIYIECPSQHLKSLSSETEKSIALQEK